MKYLILLILLIGSVSFSKTKQINIVVLDTGLNLEDNRFKNHLCKEGHKDFTKEGLDDIDSHGTHIVGNIIKYAKQSNYCLVIVKYYSKHLSPKENFNNYFSALRYSVNLSNINIINISGGGTGFNLYEYDLIKNHENILFVVAAGNNGKNYDETTERYYPAMCLLSNIIPVGSLDRDNKRLKSSNYGSIIKRWELGKNVLSTCPVDNCYMTGNSISASIATGKIIRNQTK